jgi:hypothetical protein
MGQAIRVAISQTQGFVRSTKRRARLLAKVYEVDPMVCPKCGAEMKVIAIIEDPDELKRILQHLVKLRRFPPGFYLDRLNRQLLPLGP